jgi:hypothetical protein
MRIFPLRIHQAGTGGSGVASIPPAVTWLKRLGHTPEAHDSLEVPLPPRPALTATLCMRMPLPLWQTLAACNHKHQLHVTMTVSLSPRWCGRLVCLLSAESHLRGVIAYRLVERAHERHSEPLWHQAG